MTNFTINHQTFKMRGVAILTGGVLAATALFHPAPVQAKEKNEKLYKGGAAALGVLGAYFILKGKTIPGAIAGAGAYYSYKKGQQANNDDRYGYNDDRYSDNDYSDDYYSNDRNSNDRYSNNNSYPDGSWSTPDSNSRREDNHDYRSATPSSNDYFEGDDSRVVLK